MILSAATIVAFAAAIVLCVLLLIFVLEGLDAYLKNRKDRKAARRRNQATKR